MKKHFTYVGRDFFLPPQKILLSAIMLTVFSLYVSVPTFAKSFETIGKKLQQEKVVKGIIKDADGNPIPGVAVIIKGTKSGTETDFDGAYTLSAKSGDILVISFIGMLTQEIIVGEESTVNVQLETDLDQLEEVVLVGYGSQKKVAVVGAISTIKPSELKIPSSNLTTALAGRVAGLVAFQTSGEPGKDNAQFFVRGITTFAQGAKPLILIDGVELTADDLARMNTDDIESFSVLKDATSTAVYGARGANGVIMVTTKQGFVGKARVSLRMENSFSSNIRTPELADAISYMNNFNEAVRTRTPGALVPFSEEKIFNTVNNVNGDVFPSTDWQDELIKDVAVNQRLNLSVRGGGEVAQYFFATSFNKDGGILESHPDDSIDNDINLKKYSIRSNITVNLSKTTKAIVRFSSTLDEYRGPAQSASNIFSQTLLTSPVRFPAVYNPDEANKDTPNILYGNERVQGNTFYVNPYQQLLSGYSQSSRALALVQVEVQQDLDALVKGLRVRFLGNNNRTSFYSLARSTTPFFYHAEEFNYDPIDNTYILTELNDDGSRALSFTGGGANVVNTIYGELAFDYARSFEKHSVSGLLVGIAREQSVSAAESLEASLPFRNLGVSGRLTYDYNTKYFFEFNFGYNGSERFAEKNRFGFFPSIGGSWLISNEGFYGESDIVNRLKIRASYGIVGNDAIGGADDRFFYRSQVNLNVPGAGYVFGDPENSRFIPGITVSNYENTDITWEKAKTMNLGLEADFFNSAITLRADYFTQQRDNILQNRLTPYSLGLEVGNRDNVGSAFTEGLDMTIEGRKTFNNDMWASIRGNFTYSNGKFDHFEEPDYALQGAPSRARTGAKIGQVYGLIAERLFLDDEEVANSPQQNFGGLPPLAGDIKYKDINEDGQINDLDRVGIGNPQVPQITYGMGFSFIYKNFDISAFFQGNAKVSIFIDPAATAPFITRLRQEDQLGGSLRYASESNLLKVYADNHWTEANRDVYATYPRLSDSPVPNNNQASTWWLKDGSFLRFKQLEVGYNFPNIGDNLRVYASGTNLMTWSKFKLWDPEVGGNGFGYPLQQVFNLGLQINL